MADSVSLTSDFDYLKIVSDDTQLLTTAASFDPDFQFPISPLGGFGAGEQAVLTVNHNLGTIPMVRAFIDPGANGLWYQSATQIGFILIDPLLISMVSTTTLKLCIVASAHKVNIPVYYRIYDINNQAVNSDSRIDKIFSKNSTNGSLPVCAFAGDNTQTVLTIPHGQSEAICWTLQFSQDNVNWYNEANYIAGGPDLTSGPPGGPYSRYYYTRAYGSADNSNFYIRLEHNYPSVRTIYVRYTLDYRS